MLLDLIAADGASGPKLFVDDNRCSTSSPAAVPVVLQAVKAYARDFGVVFESGGDDKSAVVMDSADARAISDMQRRVHGLLQGGTPSVVTSRTFLGVADGPAQLANDRLVRQIELRGSRQMRNSTCNGIRDSRTSSTGAVVHS